MHSSLNRAQAVFGFFTTVALFVAGFAALSVLLFPADDANARVSLKDVKVTKGRPNYYSTRKEEYAQLRFDLDADLSPLFNWNTKQLFVYVYASYSSSDNPSSSSLPASESIIWDTIIQAPESPYSFASLQERFFPAFSSSSSKNKLKSKRSSSSSKKPTSKSSSSSSSSKKDTAVGLLRLRDQRSKYQISDITGRVADRQNVTLHVGWNVQPWVGALWWSPRTGAVPRTSGDAGRSEAFGFPALKVRNAESSQAV